MIEATILASLCDFLLDHKADIASKIVASAGYDALKASLNFKGLKTKLDSFFKKESDTDKFIETLCVEQLSNDSSVPLEEVKTVYEAITQEPFDENIIRQIGEWLRENQQAIEGLDITINSNNSGGFNIGSQNAAGSIYNIQGDYNAKKE